MTANRGITFGIPRLINIFNSYPADSDRLSSGLANPSKLTSLSYIVMVVPMIVRQTSNSPVYQTGAFHIRGGVTILITFGFLRRAELLVMLPIPVVFKELLDRALNHLSRLDQAFLKKSAGLGVNIFF